MNYKWRLIWLAAQALIILRSQIEGRVYTNEEERVQSGCGSEILSFRFIKRDAGMQPRI